MGAPAIRPAGAWTGSAAARCRARRTGAAPPRRPASRGWPRPATWRRTGARASKTLRRAGSLRLRSSVEDVMLEGRVHDRFDQYAGEVPIFGAQIVRQRSANGVETVFGELHPDDLGHLARRRGSRAVEAAARVTTLTGFAPPERLGARARRPAARGRRRSSADVAGEGSCTDGDFLGVFVDAQTGDEVLRYSAAAQAVGGRHRDRRPRRSQEAVDAAGVGGLLRERHAAPAVPDHARHEEQPHPGVLHPRRRHRAGAVGHRRRYAFTRWDGIAPSQWVGLHNFRLLWDDPIFRNALRNNAIFALSVPIQLVAAADRRLRDPPARAGLAPLPRDRLPARRLRDGRDRHPHRDGAPARRAAQRGARRCRTRRACSASGSGARARRSR